MSGTSAGIGDSDTTHASLLELLHAARGDAARLLVLLEQHTGNDEKEYKTCVRVLSRLDAVIESLSKPNPDGDGFYWWLIAIGFSADLVADGVDMTRRRAHEIISKVHPYAITNAIRAKIITRPDDAAMAAEHGFPDKASYLAHRMKTRGE